MVTAIILCLACLIPAICGLGIRSYPRQWRTGTIRMVSRPAKNYISTVAPELQLSSDVSELPDSFSDAVERAVSCSLACFETGSQRCRIDFDTSIGDLTYTSIKNSMPMVKELVRSLDKRLGLVGPSITELPPTQGSNKSAKKPVLVATRPPKGSTSEIDDTEAAEAAEIRAAEALDTTATSAVPSSVTPNALRTLRIFFPDMGAAALARRDWKMGTNATEVPTSVTTANIQNDPLAATDQLAIILCPLYSETEFVKRVMDLCDEARVPCIMINPELVNIEQGYGVRKYNRRNLSLCSGPFCFAACFSFIPRTFLSTSTHSSAEPGARNIRSTLINTFPTSYKLKTLKMGALVREWPSGYSLWMEDASTDEGYALVQTFVSEPPREVVEELLDVSNTLFSVFFNFPPDSRFEITHVQTIHTCETPFATQRT